MSKHDYFQKLLSGEIVSDEEYKKIIIIKLNKHLVIRMFVSRGVCMCIHPPTHTHTHKDHHHTNTPMMMHVSWALVNGLRRASRTMRRATQQYHIFFFSQTLTLKKMNTIIQWLCGRSRGRAQTSQHTNTREHHSTEDIFYTNFIQW